MVSAHVKVTQARKHSPLCFYTPEIRQTGGSADRGAALTTPPFSFLVFPPLR